MEKIEFILLSEPGSDKLSNHLKAQEADMVIISDECGDSLWEAVLAQDKHLKQSDSGGKN